MKIKLLCAAAVLAAFSSLYGDVAVKNGNTIAFLGDSITSLGSRNPAGYLNLVICGLRANGINALPIRAGIGGQKAPNMLARLERDIIRKKPQFMTLSCGVNDVWHQRYKKGVELEDYKKCITEIVEKAQKANIKVMIMTATMIYEDPNNSFNKKLAVYNDFLRQLAKEKNCLLADTNAAMQLKLAELKKSYPGIKGNLLTTDGVHMNPVGDVVMAEAVLKSFGLNDAQLAKARASWQGRSSNFGVFKLKAAHFPAIFKAADAKKCSWIDIVNQLIEREFSK